MTTLSGFTSPPPSARSSPAVSPSTSSSGNRPAETLPFPAFDTNFPMEVQYSAGLRTLGTSHPPRCRSSPSMMQPPLGGAPPHHRPKLYNAASLGRSRTHPQAVQRYFLCFSNFSQPPGGLCIAHHSPCFSMLRCQLVLPASSPYRKKKFSNLAITGSSSIYTGEEEKIAIGCRCCVL